MVWGVSVGRRVKSIRRSMECLLVLILCGLCADAVCISSWRIRKVKNDYQDK